MEVYRKRISSSSLSDREVNTALSIWTHNLRGIEYINNFKPTSCPYNAALTGIRVAAGEVGSDIQAVADSHGVAVVGGGNPVSSHTSFHFSFC